MIDVASRLPNCYRCGLQPCECSDGVTLYHGRSEELLPLIPENTFTSCVTDPPYHLTQGKGTNGFMGKTWDGGDIAFRPEFWAEVLRVLKPGAFLLAFGGSRTFHRLTCAIEDAGFEIRDCIMWLYGQGFPKSHDISKAIDKAAGAEREVVRVPANECRNQKATGGGRNGASGATRPWIEKAMEVGFHEKDGNVPITPLAKLFDGYGTALKPSFETIVVAMKSLDGTFAQNAQRHGVAGINVDGSRVETDDELRSGACGLFSHKRDGKPYPNGRDGEKSAQKRYDNHGSTNFALTPGPRNGDAKGRWPANLVHDGSEEVVGLFPNGAARFYMTCPQDSTCILCGMPYDKHNDTKGASLCQPKLKAPVQNAENHGLIIHPIIESIALSNAQLEQAAKIVRNAKFAGNLCDSCAIAFAHALVGIKRWGSSREASVAIQDCTENSGNSILIQNLASCVAALEGIDTIPTTQSLLKLFGCVLPAIEEYTKQESKDVAAAGSAQDKAIRFRYEAKADPKERDGSRHPTVKPIDLMRWLCKLVMPPADGFCLDPFAGSGTTLLASHYLGQRCVGIEMDDEHVEDARARIDAAVRNPYLFEGLRSTKKKSTTCGFGIRK